MQGQKVHGRERAHVPWPRSSHHRCTVRRLHGADHRADDLPGLHPLPINANWEWSTVSPDIIYFLNGAQLAAYNKSTEVVTNLGGPPNGDPVGSWAVVVGLDQWICSAAGLGAQDTFTELFC